MINLSKRLKQIADLVDNDSVIADIGCDHALLDIYLLQNKIIKKSVACDITEGALNQAKKNVSLNNVKNIDLRLSDGLDEITEKDNIDTIVMSGLGDIKIINIIKNNINKIKNINTFIIQSNTGVSKIRSYLVGINYYIESEVLVKENNIIYTIIKFKKGFKKYSKKELLYGPILLKEKDELFNELIASEINSNIRIIKKLPKNMVIKKIKLHLNNKKLKQLLK